jgi:uncharacterized protein YceK
MRDVLSRLRQAMLATVLGLSLVMVAHVEPAYAAGRHGYNDEYIFATTRGLVDTDLHPSLKVTLFPATLVIDTVLLPVAAIAGFVTQR